MKHQLQLKNLEDRSDVSRLPAAFIVLCVVAFIASVSATIYFINTMGYEMNMPGGWKMSMMYMRMSGTTWLLSSFIFLLMWLAMMVSMMMPSTLPMFLKTRRQWRSLCYMASGYFFVWLIAGIGIYILGVTFNSATMYYLFLSRAVLLISGGSLIATGIFQFTRWKMIHLLDCRSTSGCASLCSKDLPGFTLGCKQGITCCACCAALMTAQLLLGIMNPLVMIFIAIVIAAEKLLPKPEVTARVAGFAFMVTGIAMIMHWVAINSV